jgi:undecaprenyl diphosphate synthase
VNRIRNSTLQGLHVAIIMDGNGRWARSRGRPRTAGHRAGSDAVRRTVEACPDSGVTTLTLYAFSCDNWQRPAGEVATLMRLFHRYLIQERQRAIRNGVRLNVIGRRDRLDPKLLKVIETTEALTARCSDLHLRIAVDYSARHSIEAAARRTPADETGGVEAFYRRLNETIHSDPATPPVDLLIRTSGEQRLSDFLLWECAYAELHFTPQLWPDFGAADLAHAVEDFAGRDRRFGRIPVESLPA